MVGHLLELGDGILRDFGNLVGVDADGGVDFGMAIRQEERGSAGFQVGADGDHAGDPGLDGPADDRIAVGIEITEVEMTMSINEHI